MAQCIFIELTPMPANGNNPQKAIPKKDRKKEGEAGDVKAEAPKEEAKAEAPKEEAKAEAPKEEEKK